MGKKKKQAQAGAESTEQKVEVFEPDVVEDEETEEVTVAVEAQEEAEQPKEETKEDQIEKLQEKIKELEDNRLRSVAELENFKKRAATELRSRLKYATQSLAQSILPGLDNLERAIEQAKQQENEQLQDFIRGIEMAAQNFHDAFEKNQIERIDPLGEPFDPNLHEAMGILETDEYEPGHVAAVFQAGYKLHDRIVRPAMVQVAKKKN